MGKTNDLAASFIQQTRTISSAPRNPINAFNALFSVQDLPEKDARAIEKIFVDGYEPGLFHEEAVQKDIDEIKGITKELKAIRKQEIVLIGERLYRAREVFKNYKDRSFREWLEYLFGSFKTGYNYLAFYDLHTQLPLELQDPFKEMPAKAAYILASKKAPIEVKAEIVKHHSNDSSSRLIAFIQETLGEKGGKELFSEEERAIASLEKTSRFLVSFKGSLSVSQKEKLSLVVQRLQNLIESAAGAIRDPLFHE